MSTDTKFLIVAIDGPAASGKSSVARNLAQRLDFAYINSGALYRAIAWLAAVHHIRPDDMTAIMSRLQQTCFEFGIRNKELFILIDGTNPGTHLREHIVNRTVSVIASAAEIRAFLLIELRAFIRYDNLVMEGRDIGSSVFPDTPFKFYIDASPHIRAQRREAQGFQDDLGYRDLVDSSRQSSPLALVKDAYRIDSSTLSIDAVVDRIIDRLKAQSFPTTYLQR